MIAVMVARPDVTFYAVHLAWVPITLFVAIVLGLLSVTVKALWEMFHE